MHLIASPGMYFPRELASQIHCYMTGLGPNPSIDPGDAEVPLLPPPAKYNHPGTYSNS